MKQQLTRVMVALSMVMSVFMVHAQPGTLDMSFDPGSATGTTFGVPTNGCAVQADGKVIYVGYFQTFRGQPMNRIVRLNSDGSLDPGFNIGSGFNGTVNCVKVLADGKILAAGPFSSFNGTPRGGVVRLNVDGSLDTQFSVGTSAIDVRTIAVQADGDIIIGGFFSAVAGVTRNNLARLNSDGSLDPDYPQGTGFNSLVQSCALQADGKIICGGYFTSFNGTSCQRVARLLTDGSYDPTFVTGAGADDVVLAVSVQADGKILVGGHFTQVNGMPRSKICRLDQQGTVDMGFNIGTGFTGGGALAIVVQPDQKVVVGGQFNSFNGVTRNCIARLESSGSLDQTFVAGFSHYVFGIALQPDGKLICAGLFGVVISEFGRGAARLNGCTPTTYYADSDGDSYGDPNSSQSSCNPIPGYVLNNADCDDTDPGILGATQWWQDADGDSWGAPFTMVLACTQPPGYVANDLDCDDSDAGIQPTEWCVDVDSDGHGDPNNTIIACAQPLGTVPQGGLCDDCSDDDASIHPGATCDDGDPCTGNDMYTSGCDCVGTYQDTDSDGVCDGLDDCPSVFGEIGSPCDDGDAYTIQDALNASCTCAGRLTQLTDAPDPIVTCGMMNMQFGSTILYAFEVPGANRYRFNFVNIPGQPAYSRNITYSTRSFLLNEWATLPFKAGRTYQGKVQVSFDGGTTYGPWGPTCNVRMGYPPQMALESGSNSLAGAGMIFWPNPNDGSELNIRIQDMERVDGQLFVELIDQLGRVVEQRALQLPDPTATATMELPVDISPGLYVVRATIGDRHFTEHLIVE